MVSGDVVSGSYYKVVCSRTLAIASAGTPRPYRGGAAAAARDGGGVAAAAAAARPHGAAPHLEGVHVHVHAHDEALHHLSAAVRLLPTFTEASCLQACQWHVHGMCMAWCMACW